MPEDSTDRPERAAGLEVNEVDDGFVVYQPSPERVHHLNSTAAFVLELSNGERTQAQIAEEMRSIFGLDEAPLDAVAGCVIELRSLGLLR